MRTNNEHTSYICENEKCLGCMACFNICPVDAIVLDKDELGTVYPIIDNYKCVSCKQCSQVCPVINPVKGYAPLSGYAAYCKNEDDKKTCSSGGIATAFYREIIKQGGMIVGAVVDGVGEPYLKCTNNESYIDKFKGSKYVCVNPQRVYSNIKEALDNRQKVLFIGTPCQVDGLKHFLKHDYNDLITVDLICHGTPPYEYLKQHIRSNTPDECNVLSYSFRGEYDFRLVIRDNHGIIYSKRSDEDYYFTSFLKGLIHREVCYSCPYANQMRFSDITVGDYWGAPTGTLGGYTGKVSAVLVNSKKGQEFFDSIQNTIESELSDVNLIVQGNNQLKHPSTRHKDRKDFVNHYKETHSFHDAIDKTSIVQLVNKTRIRNRLLTLPRFVKHRVLHL